MNMMYEYVWSRLECVLTTVVDRDLMMCCSWSLKQKAAMKSKCFNSDVQFIK